MGNDAKIGNYAFYNTGIEEIEISGNFVEVGEYAFAECDLLSSIRYNSYVNYYPNEYDSVCQEIRNYAFSNCPNLVTVGLTDSIKVIDSKAFENSKSVTIYAPEVTEEPSVSKTFATENNIPFVKDYEGITEDGFVYKEIFGKVEIVGYEGSDTEITIPATIDGYEVVIGESAFEYSELTSVIISEGISVIKNAAFRECHGLEEIELPSTITYIGSSAFENITSCFSKITFKEGNKPARIMEWAISSDMIKSVEIPGNYVYIGEYAINSFNLEEFTWEESKFGICQMLSYGALAYSESLKKVSLPSTLEHIGDLAFLSCTALEEIVIPENVVTVGDSVFQNCNSLKSIKVLSDTVKFGKNIVDNTILFSITQGYMNTYTAKC